MHWRLVLSLCGAWVGVTCGSALFAGQAQDSSVSRRVIPLEEVSGPARETLATAVGHRTVGRINAVAYRGVPVVYEIDQQLDRRRVEIVIRYDGPQVPSQQLKRPRTIETRVIDAAKLPQKVSAAAERQQVTAGTIQQVREVIYRGTPVLLELDAAGHCYGYYLDGQLAFKSPLPTTQPTPETPEEGQETGDETGNSAE